MRFGTEKETQTIDDQGSTLTVIRKVRDYEVVKSYKQFNVRVKVRDIKEEMAEYVKHTEAIRDKRTAGVLVVKDDASLVPSFIVEFPKFDADGSYFVCKTWAEWID